MRLPLNFRTAAATQTLFSYGISLILMLVGAGCTKRPSQNDPLLADQGVQFPGGMPADPGARGKEELQGVDSDGNGVRDDVQRWIYARHPQDAKKQAALSQGAKSYQEMVLPKSGLREMQKAMGTMAKAIDCIYARFPHGQSAHVEMGYLKARVLNTADRSRAFLKNDAFLDGTTLGPIPGKGEGSCE